MSFAVDVGGVGGDITPPWRVRRRHYQEAADRRRQEREDVVVSFASNTNNDSAHDCDDGRDGDCDGDGTDGSELSTMDEPSGHVIVQSSKPQAKSMPRRSIIQNHPKGMPPKAMPPVLLTQNENTSSQTEETIVDINGKRVRVTLTKMMTTTMTAIEEPGSQTARSSSDA